MKKFIPLIMLLVGVIIVVGAFLLVKSRKAVSGDEEAALPEVPLAQRPVVSLTPSEDGHYLKLKIEKIVLEVATLDYELLYSTKDGILQGVPGSSKLEGKKEYDTDLLLGSESSGKFRYDEGVEEGSITIRFRDSKGKLTAKFESDFHLQNPQKEKSSKLTSKDGKFEFEIDASPEVYFVTMSTIGCHEGKDDIAECYGIFSSSSDSWTGKTQAKYYYKDDVWRSIENEKVEIPSVFAI